MKKRRFSGMRGGLGLMLLAVVVASPAIALELVDPSVGGARRRPTIVILPSAATQMVAGANTSCMCGAFSCKGQEFPACSVQCVEPQTGVCDCGFCERTMGTPNSGALGPVANDCACQ